MDRADKSFIYGRWYVGWKGAAFVFIYNDWDIGYYREWYDGPLYRLSFGPFHWTYVP